MSEKTPVIADLRAEYHRRIFTEVLRKDGKGIPNNADASSTLSARLAQGVASRINLSMKSNSLSGQSAGKAFEEATAAFIEAGFSRLDGLRPGTWKFKRGGEINRFDQYSHLAEIAKAIREHAVLLATLGDYIVKPDIVVTRVPEEDTVINAGGKRPLVNGNAGANYTPLRRRDRKATAAKCWIFWCPAGACAILAIYRLTW